MTITLHRGMFHSALAGAALWVAPIARAGEGPIYVAPLSEAQNGQTISTTSASLITGFYKETGKGLTGWQSCRILLIAGGALGNTASGSLDVDDDMLTLTQGWAVVSVSYEKPAEALDRDVFRPWVFINIGGVGAGAEGTEFIVERTGNITRIDTIAENGAHDVLLDVPLPNGVDKRLVRLPNNRHLEITQNALGVYVLNGTTIDQIAEDAEVPAMSRPAGRQQLLDGIRAKSDTVHPAKQR